MAVKLANHYTKQAVTVYSITVKNRSSQIGKNLKSVVTSPLNYCSLNHFIVLLKRSSQYKTSNYACFKTGVFNLLSSRANLHLSYNPAGRSHCRLQNHHGYIKHLHRGMGGSPGDVGEVPMTQVKQRKGCRMSCDVGNAVEPHSPTLTSFTYVTAHSPTLSPLYLRHSSF